MDFKCILFLFICYFTHIYSTQEKPCHRKLNVVLFFAKSTNLPKEASAMKLLDMNEMARVKHSIASPHNRQPYNALHRNTPNCKELLKESLSSLIHFCQNALGMKTAVASVSSQEITSDINNSEPDTPPEIRERQIFNADNYIRNNKVRRPHNKEETIPSYTRPRALNFRDIITSPEHTEVFKIRVKRNEVEKEEKPGEIVDIPLEKDQSKAPWDVLDVMSHVRFSFFGKLFENEEKNKLAEEENQVTSEIGKTKQDPGLFETVKSTLSSLQETPGEPFLMVVFGGHLSEICDKQSPLIQSIKHVIESTTPESTLIILTGTCPEQHEKEHENVVVINEDAKNEHHEHDVVPVFAKGPKSDKLTECTELYDVPLTIKNILAEMSPTFGENVEPSLQRQKRSILNGIPVNREHYEYRGSQPPVYNVLQSVIVYLSASVLFII